MNEIIKVNLETITPLWTGNAWGENTEIKPQSIMGALRFWFEVYCYAAGIPVKNYGNEQLNFNKFQKSLKSKLKEEIDLDEAEDMVLAEQGISLPSRIFGCRGWRGWIKIIFIRLTEGYCFKNYLNLPEVIYKDKNNSRDSWEETKRRNVRELRRQNRNYHFWYFGIPYFWGKFSIDFQVKEQIGEYILFPLLSFIQQYGSFGGKNNLGYGRVKIKINNEDVNNEIFEFSKFKKYNRNSKQFSNYKDRKITDAINGNKNSIEDLIETERKIGFWKIGNISSELIKIIEELISTKASSRRDFKYGKNNDNLRHFIFGNARGELQATKIIPWINKISDKNYEYGFISLIGLKQFLE